MPVLSLTYDTEANERALRRCLEPLSLLYALASVRRPTGAPRRGLTRPSEKKPLTTHRVNAAKKFVKSVQKAFPGRGSR